MATNRSKPAPKRETRTPVTFETAAQLCPHQGVAENVAQAFGLIVPEYDAIRTEHATADLLVRRMREREQRLASGVGVWQRPRNGFRIL